MPDFDIKHRLCVGDQAVPIDITNLHIIDDGQESTEDLVSLNWGTRSDRRWLVKALNVKHTFFRRHYNQIPFVKEVQDAIMGGRPTDGRLALGPKTVVSMHVRGRKVFATHRTNGLCLYCKCGEEVDLVQWVLEQLALDLETFNPAEPTGDVENNDGMEDEPQSDIEVEAEADEENTLAGEPLLLAADVKAREELLENLRKHPQCRTATWRPSRKGIAVRRSDGVSSEFRACGHVKRLKAWHERQDESSWRNLHDLYEQSFDKAINFLDGKDPFLLRCEPVSLLPEGVGSPD